MQMLRAEERYLRAMESREYLVQAHWWNFGVAECSAN
jgi:hypothetical protein